MPSRTPCCDPTDTNRVRKRRQYSPALRGQRITTRAGEPVIVDGLLARRSETNEVRKRARSARRLFQMGEDERARRVLWGGERKLSYKGRRRNGGPPDLPRALGLSMALGTVVILAGFGAVAFNMWPDLKARFEPRVVSRVTAGGAPELVVQRDRSGHYVVPGTVNGVEVEFLLDTGATNVAIPPALAERLNLRRGPEVEIRTASDIIPGYLVTLD